MGVLRDIRQRAFSFSFPLPSGDRIVAAVVAVIYATLLSICIPRHEPWADEAQAWLLARDSSLIELWGRLLAYEGSPGLWHTLLHVLIRLGLPYSCLSGVSGCLGLIAAWLIAGYAPLPAGFRVLLPFTFFLSYQYAIVARSYSLIPVLLVSAACLYSGGARHILKLTALLILMAMVSLHGMLLAASIWVSLYAVLLPRLARTDRRRIIGAAAVFVLALGLIVLISWPPADGTFVTRANLSAGHAISVAGVLLREAFTGNGLLTTLVIVLSIPFLWRGGGLPLFLLSSVAQCAAGAVIYWQVWHQGMLLLGWLVAIWISAQKVRLTRSVLFALALVISIQVYWAVESMRYDWGHAYSAGRETAEYLRDSGIAARNICAIGYATTSVQPYFSSNIFSDIHNGGKAGYWDWSNRNRAKPCRRANRAIASGIRARRIQERV